MAESAKRPAEVPVYVEGEDLKKFMQRSGRRREPDEAVRLVLQIVRALEAAHDKGVIHRDLKPENVMLNEKHEPVIMDFGLARRAIGSSDAGLTQGMIVGTAAYISPEQTTGKAEGIDHRSDLYAVGVMLFEMLTGEWPFTGGAVEVMGKKCVLDPPPPRSLNPNLHPKLAAVCYKMIAKQKENRYATCAEVIAALEAIDLSVPVLPRTKVNTVAPAPNIDSQREGAANSVRRETSLSAVGKNSQSAVGKKKGRVHKSPSGFLPVQVQRWNAIPAGQRLILLGGSGVFLFALAAIPFFRIAPKLIPSNASAEFVVTQSSQPSQDRPVSLSHVTELTDRRVDGDGFPHLPMEIAAIAGRTDGQQTSSEPIVGGSEAETESVLEPNSEPVQDSESKSDVESMSNDNLVGNESAAEDESANDTDDLIEKAILLMKGSQRKEAIPSLKRASNLAPKDLRADFYLGLLYLGFGSKEPKEARTQIESSEMHFRRVVDRSPGHVAASNNLALVELKLRKFASARNYFGIAGKQNPRPLEVNQNLGRLLSQIKIFDIKADELKRINGLNTVPTDFRSQTGWMYMPLDGSEKTIRECKTFCPSGLLEDPSCSSCNGCSKLLCRNCGGKGKIGQMGNVSEKRDIGFGVTVTSVGSTTNVIACQVCGGRGRVDCNGCVDGRDPSLRR